MTNPAQPAPIPVPDEIVPGEDLVGRRRQGGCGCGCGGHKSEAPVEEARPEPAPQGGGCGCGGHDHAGPAAMPTGAQSLPMAQGSEPELDARRVPHVIRHATVFALFDTLTPGTSMRLIAPHDPTPLLAQMSERVGTEVPVEYLERGERADEVGPVWALRLTRPA